MLTAHEDHFAALAANPAQWASEPQKWGKVQGYSSGMLSVTGFDFPVGSGAKILTENGNVVGAEVAGLATTNVFGQPATSRRTGSIGFGRERSGAVPGSVPSQFR